MGSGRYLAIDFGYVNYAAIVNNIGKEPFLLSSKDIEKEIVNKTTQLKRLKTKLYQFKKKSYKESYVDKTVRDIAKLEEEISDLGYKRDNFEYLAASYILRYCIKNTIGTIIYGDLEESTRKEKFKHELFFRLLEESADKYDVSIEVIDERYTSGTSFLDDEEPTKANYNKNRRVMRGFFRSRSGTYIDADINAAYQIMRKYDPDCFNEYNMREFIVPRVVDFNEIS